MENLTKEELQYVLKSDPSVDGIVHLLAYTGMRPGELRALRLEDIDLDKSTVHVRRAASIEKTFDKTGKPTGRSEYIKATKSEYECCPSRGKRLKWLLRSTGE